MKDLEEKLKDRLDSLEYANHLRSLRRIDRVFQKGVGEGASSNYFEICGQSLLDFCSNDYLGLRNHPLLIQRSCEFTHRWGVGSGASRLVAGNLAPFESIERKIAAGKGTEAALVFNSGFQANATVLPALVDLLGEVNVFTDKLSHASIHYGFNACAKREIRFRHNDFDHLEMLLKKHSRPGFHNLIVTETVFSMDGDRLDIPTAICLAQKYGAILYLDEAHATGVFGSNGFGLASGLPQDAAILIMGTFSKALGSFGAYLACSQRMREFLVNRCGGFIYSTALPPSVLGSIDAALDLLPTLENERARLQTNSEQARSAIRAAGFDIGLSNSQIIPIVLREESVALRYAEALNRAGLLVAAVRPPTVLPGQSRIRVCINSKHTSADIDRLLTALSGIECSI